jgi:hypothetical protein
MGEDVIPEIQSLPVAASTLIYAGAQVAVNTAGNAVPASADPTLHVMGVAEARADNSSGLAGAIRVIIRRGAMGMRNSATTDAITSADVGRPCYAVDDQTVARTSAGGTRPVSGLVNCIDNGLVYVEIGSAGVGAEGSSNVVDVEALAGATLTAAQYLFVKLDTNGAAVLAGAGERAFGVLQNAPASGAVAIIRVFGLTNVIAGATTTRGGQLASDAAGKAKNAVNATCDSSGASATAVISGSFMLGTGLVVGSANVAMQMLFNPVGSVGATAA